MIAERRGGLDGIRANFFQSTISPPVYPEGLQRFASLLKRHGFSPYTLVPQENGTTVSGDGELTIHWDKRVLEPRI